MSNILNIQRHPNGGYVLTNKNGAVFYVEDQFELQRALRSDSSFNNHVYYTADYRPSVNISEPAGRPPKPRQSFTGMAMMTVDQLVGNRSGNSTRNIDSMNLQNYINEIDSYEFITIPKYEYITTCLRVGDVYIMITSVDQYIVVSSLEEVNATVALYPIKIENKDNE